MQALLRVENLRVEAKVGPKRFAPIVKDVSFAVAPGGPVLSNAVSRPGAASQVSFLGDRIQFREELGGNSLRRPLGNERQFSESDRGRGDS